jgi:NAD(P)-dependent dehydrogenase (short-subunit alcohol dehydrogenase family)
MNPMKKIGDVADIANSIVFLASNETPFMLVQYYQWMEVILLNNIQAKSIK